MKKLFKKMQEDVATSHQLADSYLPLLEEDKNKILRQVADLRQLVAEGLKDTNIIYYELCKIAPLMSKKDEKAMNKHFNNMFK